MATYQNTKPAAADQLNQSQADIQQNFLALDDYVNVDHVDFAGGAGDEGKHAKATFPEQGADPTPGANEVNIYAKTSALGDAGTALFFRKESSGTVVNFTSSTQHATGWTRLPSGILLKWGSGTGSAADTLTFPVAATVPAFTAIYQVLITNGGDGGLGSYDYQVYLTAIAVLTFSVYCSARTVNASRNNCPYSYLAIGI